MSEKRYPVEMPNHFHAYHLKRCEIECLKAQCEKALEQAEAEKPKAWDFCLAPNFLHMHTGRGWSSNISPWEEATLDNNRIHILGNLKDIVENQGPIVIGMTEGEADIMEERLRGYVGIGTQLMRSRILDAHERFRKGRRSKHGRSSVMP